MYCYDNLSNNWNGTKIIRNLEDYLRNFFKTKSPIKQQQKKSTFAPILDNETESIHSTSFYSNHIIICSSTYRFYICEIWKESAARLQSRVFKMLSDGQTDNGRIVYYKLAFLSGQFIIS